MESASSIVRRLERSSDLEALRKNMAQVWELIRYPGSNQTLVRGISFARTPLFGGKRPQSAGDLMPVWAWSDTHVLLGESWDADHLRIITREQFSAECAAREEEGR